MKFLVLWLLLILAGTGLAAAESTTAARSAVAQPDTSDLIEAPVSALADTLAAPLTPLTVQIEPLDVWSTGVSSTAAVLMTPLFPGWGQLYTDNSWRAALAFGVETFYWSNLLLRDRRAVRARDYSAALAADDPLRSHYYDVAQENWEQMRDFAWWSGGVLLIIALDAYVGAHLFNFEQDPVPVPNDWEGEFGPPGGDMPGSTATPSLVVFQYGWRF